MSNKDKETVDTKKNRMANFKKIAFIRPSQIFKRRKEKIKNLSIVQKTWWWRRFFLKISSNNPVIKVFLLYLIIILVFAGLLLIKGTQTSSYYHSADNNFFYAFFTVLSTITETGIMLHQIPKTYTIAGQVILFILMEFGSLIFSYIVTHVYINFRSNRGNRFTDQFIVQIEKGENKINSSFSIIKWNILVIGSMQILFAFILFACIFYIPGYEPGSTYYGQNFNGFTNITNIQYHHAILAFWSGVFDSAGAITNTGMTLFGFVNLDIYRNGIGIIIQFILGVEFICGGFGFPIFYDLILKIKMRTRNVKYKFSLYSKISLWAVFLSTLITTILAYCLAYFDHSATSIIGSTNYDEFGKLNTMYSPWGTNPILDKNWAIFFSMLNTHSAGYETINIQNLTEANKWVYIVSMFLSCSPSTTTGQIKLVVMVSGFYLIVKKINRGNKFENLKNSITTPMIWNSFIVSLIGIVICIVGTVAFYFCFNGSFYDVNGYPLDHFTDSVFLSVSVYSMVGLIPGSIIDQNFDGYLAMLLIIMASQSTIVLSIFVIQRYSYVSKSLRKKRLEEIRRDVLSKKYSDYLN